MTKKYYKVIFECDHDCTASCDDDGWCDIRVNMNATYEASTPEEAIKLCKEDYLSWNCDVYDYVVVDSYSPPSME